ncbi:GNAT family N-acetyltransferase [Sphingobacterium sp. SRCM116780]|uniref:GNAT family N-acetyltransferase n=1 Tax=Sphingobacterium sp. SRCM116780 TaxID=2907623 RepID=UPI001F3A44C1|nr:GNAT family N-acetyltransferase [Sphingobacterium sp. SRCM116780]UIR57411.1 GNAT family N-acetyltransferase [Sphingobacterium sp. SRCM116780]
MGQKFRFKKYEAADYPEYFEMVQDDRVMKYITGNGLSNAEAKKKFASILDINHADEFLGYFQIWDNETQQIIGDCKLVPYRHNPAVFEIGYLLQVDYWRKGYGTMICTHLLDLATAIDTTKAVIGIIHPENQASRKLLEKFGFVRYFIGIENNLATEKLILKRNKHTDSWIE